MAPIRVTPFQNLQPFAVVRKNWGTVQPYISNYTSAVTFGVIFMNFLAIIPQVIAHGFTFPRLHPALDFEDLEPSEEHANEYVSPQELAEAMIAEIEEEMREEQEQYEES